MKILHVIQSLDPAAGGPPVVATGLAAAQARLGHEPRCVAFAPPDGTHRLEALLSNGAAAGVPRDYFPVPSRLDLLLGRDRDQHARDMIAPCDVVHLHGVWDPLLHIFGNAAARAGVPYVITPHGMLDPWSLRQRRWKKRIALWAGYRRLLDASAFLHALNDDERRLLEPLRLRPPVRVIPNGVSLDELEPLPPPHAFHAAHPELAGNRYVLFLSRLHYKKGLDYLADAFAIVAQADPNIQLVVAGPDGGERRPFQERIQRLGLTSRVHLVGPLYAADKLAAIAGATCFCLPSRQEGFSVAVTEALACGVPVVISHACHFPEVATEGAGVIVSLDPADVARGLSEVLTGGAVPRQRMAAAGRAMVRARYTWPKVAQQMVAAYQNARRGPVNTAVTPA